jgi:hypothetical protein
MVTLLNQSGYRNRRSRVALSMLRTLPRALIVQFFRRPRETKYRVDDYIEILVEDCKQFFTEDEHYELARFLVEDLLSSKYDIQCLVSITIDNYSHNGYDGTWTFLAKKKQGIYLAAITLNLFYLKTLNDLKETLAHEYGHHWTIVHCIKKHWTDFAQNEKVSSQRLPNLYYKMRGLDLARFHPHARFGWHLCDKEVIAEDYRVLFAPSPHNQDHGVIEEMMADEDLLDYLIQHPSDEVKSFILSLGSPTPAT